MHWIVTLIVGAVVGWLASMLMKTNAQMGAIANILVGIVGSSLGFWLAGVLSLNESWRYRCDRSHDMRFAISIPQFVSDGEFDPADFRAYMRGRRRLASRAPGRWSSRSAWSAWWPRSCPSSRDALPLDQRFSPLASGEEG
jgi:uncharacterized membrane protein YeaQ/YmgE (transglycosylase-associated protein family)